jgi:hypothetical protein
LLVSEQRGARSFDGCERGRVTVDPNREEPSGDPPDGEDHLTRWSREEQLQAVFIAHAMVVVFVLALIQGLDPKPKTPIFFFVFEGLLLIVCGWPLFKYEALLNTIEKFGITLRRGRQAGRRLTKERVAGGALYVAFLLQLAALVPLLARTGGPVDSPFAQMSVAVAIFTPFLANQRRTVMIVGVVTAVYYVVLVLALDDLGKRWPYLAVNLSILALTIVLTLGFIARREAERANGGGP